MATSHHAKTVSIALELTPDQAWVLAQFVKRVGFAEMRGNAVDDGEAHVIRDAIDVLAVALREAGFGPR